MLHAHRLASLVQYLKLIALPALNLISCSIMLVLPHALRRISQLMLNVRFAILPA